MVPDAVAAVDDVDRFGRHRRVERGEGRVIPARDGAVEDLGYRRRVEHQSVDRAEVVGDGQRAEHHGQVPGVGATAALFGCGIWFPGQWRVRSAEIRSAGEKIGDPGARSVGGVVQGLPGAGLPIGGDEFRHRVGLCGRAAGRQRLLAAAVHLGAEPAYDGVGWGSVLHAETATAAAASRLMAAPDGLRFTLIASRGRWLVRMVPSSRASACHAVSAHVTFTAIELTGKPTTDERVIDRTAQQGGSSRGATATARCGPARQDQPRGFAAGRTDVRPVGGNCLFMKKFRCRLADGTCSLPVSPRVPNAELPHRPTEV